MSAIGKKYVKKWDGKKSPDKIFGLDLDQWNGLTKYIHGYYIRTMGVHAPMLPELNARVFEFGAAGHSLVGMYNFLVWAQEIDPDNGEPNIESDTAIMATIGHDLNGMHESFFDPRTASYEYLGDEEFIMLEEMPSIHKRTFEASEYDAGSQERETLNSEIGRAHV